MKIKIVSDGGPGGAKILDAETGEEIKWISSMVLKLAFNETPTAEVKINDVRLDLAAEITHASGRVLTQCPICKANQLAQMIFHRCVGEGREG